MSDLTSALASIKLSLILLSLHGFLLHSLTNDQKKIIHNLILNLISGLNEDSFHKPEDTLILCIAVGMGWRPRHAKDTFWDLYMSVVLQRTEKDDRAKGIQDMGLNYIRSLAGTDIQIFPQHECYQVQVWTDQKVFESKVKYHPGSLNECFMGYLGEYCGWKWVNWPDGSLKITEKKKMNWGPWWIAAVALICLVLGIYIGKSGIV